MDDKIELKTNLLGHEGELSPLENERDSVLRTAGHHLVYSLEVNRFAY